MVEIFLSFYHTSRKTFKGRGEILAVSVEKFPHIFRCGPVHGGNCRQGLHIALRIASRDWNCPHQGLAAGRADSLNIIQHGMHLLFAA